jgi:hypothetical protein
MELRKSNDTYELRRFEGDWSLSGGAYGRAFLTFFGIITVTKNVRHCLIWAKIGPGGQLKRHIYQITSMETADVQPIRTGGAAKSLKGDDLLKRDLRISRFLLSGKLRSIVVFVWGRGIPAIRHQ